nr:hypothetical protein L203_03747 [Cryptococcus depauperatus CBS 7841]
MPIVIHKTQRHTRCLQAARRAWDERLLTVSTWNRRTQLSDAFSGSYPPRSLAHVFDTLRSLPGLAQPTLAAAQHLSATLRQSPHGHRQRPRRPLALWTVHERPARRRVRRPYRTPRHTRPWSERGPQHGSARCRCPVAIHSQPVDGPGRMRLGWARRLTGGRRTDGNRSARRIPQWSTVWPDVGRAQGTGCQAAPVDAVVRRGVSCQAGAQLHGLDAGQFVL